MLRVYGRVMLVLKYDTGKIDGKEEAKLLLS
jgi:hypothetical protein